MRLILIRHGDSAMAADFGVQELPVLLIAGRAKNRVRFVGTPRGNLFEGMLKAIWRASTGDDELPAEFVKDLGRVASEVYLRVFVSPTCPACKPVIDAALRMALTSSKVRADIIDATAFIDLADRFGWAVVDGEGTVDEVHGRIVAIVEERLA